MKTHVKESVLFLVLMLAFTPLAFLLMPLVAALFVVLAIVLVFHGWQTHHHGMN